MPPVILCKTNKGEPIFAGSVWRENDPRIDRTVKVVEYLPQFEKVGIQTVLMDGSLAPRLTWAARSRFGSTARGKYSLVSTPHEKRSD